MTSIFFHLLLAASRKKRIQTSFQNYLKILLPILIVKCKNYFFIVRVTSTVTHMSPKANLML